MKYSILFIYLFLSSFNSYGQSEITCEDNSSALYWYLDYDGDGLGAGDYVTISCNAPGNNFVSNNADEEDDW